MAAAKNNRGSVFLALVFVILSWTYTGSLLVCSDFSDGFPRRQLIELSEVPGLSAQFVGKGERQTRLLYRDFEQMRGYSYQSRDQNGPSCVGNATACAIDILGAVEAKKGLIKLPPDRASAAWLYGNSRVIGGMNPLRAGSHVRLAVQAAHEVGYIYEQDFFMLGYDLTSRSYEREWANGTPPELDPLAENYIGAFFKLYNYNDVRDAIASGMPVIVGSSVGFGRTTRTLVRDQDGFLNEPYFRFRGRYWFHAMCFIGVSDVGRPGVLCQNSWGEHWVIGPLKFGDEPKGSFWIDPVTVSKMIRSGDCYAIIGINRR